MHILVLGLALIAGASSAAQLSNRSFPSNFKFGVATSSYQIEGGWNEDGKGLSIWDDYTHTNPNIIPGNIKNGDVACDSYHKYEEDIKYLKELNVDFYRLSISWPRILPNGFSNNVNQKGIDYYVNILKLLKNNGIEPIVTLYHWDLPISLQQLGGWTNPEIVQYFGEYARICYKYFGEYVKYWVTLNEPLSTCVMSYGTRNGLAPGYDLEAEGVYLCAYTQVKAHALAYHIYHNEFKKKQDGKVSLSLVSHWFEPASNSSDDYAAHELAMQFLFGIFAHPIYAGNWPQLVINRVGHRSQMEGLAKSRLPAFTQEEIDYINGTYDWFGLNYYITMMVKYNLTEDDYPGTASYLIDEGYAAYADPSWNASNASPWLVNVPWGLRKLLNWIKDNYNSPEIIITENGWADDGSSLNDPDRIEYLQQHLSSVLDAIYEDGVNVAGYTQWSLMDNFEWTFGYTSKFGLLSVNFADENRARTPKVSFEWYKNLTKSRCLVDKCVTDDNTPTDSSSIVKSSFMFMLCSVVFSYVLTNIMG